jgi:glycosyltransferase involved in cell wall biosynthesis
VSVVIPARNAARTLAEQLRALCEQDYAGAWDVVVADNGSTDGTADVARRWETKLPLHVVDASAMLGAGFARNRGWQSARGDLITFCDADDVAAPSWLSRLVAVAAGVDLAGGRYEFRRLNASRRPPWWDGTSLPLGFGFLPFMVGGNFAAWRDVLATLGGFNESYRELQDVELSWRAQCAGFRVRFAPDAVVHCRYRTRFQDVARQTYRLAFQQPHLYRDFRARGMPRRQPVRFFRNAASLLIDVPACLTSRDFRWGWMRRAAEQCGRVAGSVRYGVLYL